jgi:hypothetical protein
MVFRRRKRDERPDRADADAPEYEDVAKNRLRSLGETGGYRFSDEDRGEVEARIRRMWYGAKKEGSKADPPPDSTTPDD